MDKKIKQKKRILFVITQSEWGGAQRFLYDLIASLDQNRFEPILAVGQNGDGELTRVLRKHLPLHVLPKLKRDISIGSDLGAIWELRRLIKQVLPHVLFLNSSKAGFIGTLAANFPSRWPNLRVIYRIGGWTFNDPWPSWKKKLWIVLEKISARWKDVIIVNNQHDLEQARKLNIRPRESLTLVHNGLNIYQIDFFSREEARLKLFEKVARRAGKIFQTKLLIGTIANFYPSKGLLHLISAAEAFRDNDDIAFLVLGEGEGRPELEKFITEKKLEKRVFLIGRVPQARQFLPAFDIFVLPSVKEGFPWVVLEAMAAKVPVIATSVGAIPEIIENGQNGFIVDPARPKQIAAKIRELLNDGRLRQEFGIQGHQTVLIRFSPNKMIKQIEKIL